jgi:murein DD-endopeptidase MepM/ murein hydrolase activator NlpD
VIRTGYTGNGNYVKVKHNTIPPIFTHVKNFGSTGQHVNQGDVIGRVGSWFGDGATCMLSLWKNGRQVDALRLNLPGGEPMNSKNRERYLKTIEPLKFELDSIGNL